MKKAIQILVLSLLPSLMAFAQSNQKPDFARIPFANYKNHDQQLMFLNEFKNANISHTELKQFHSISDDWLLMERTYTYLWNKKESSWINTTINFYYYDENYNLDEQLEKGADGSVPIQKTLYYYDEDNDFLTAEYISDYDAESSEWTLTKKTFYTYENDTLRYKLTQTLKDSEFKDFSLYSYVYNANHNLDYYIVQYKVSDNWINSAKWIYYYDPSNNFLYEMHNKKWDSDIDQFIDFSKNFYERDENGNLLMSESEYWNDEDNIWKKTLRQYYYYNEDGYMTSFIATRFDTENGNWDNVFMQAYTYLPAGSEQIMVQNSGINKSIDDFQTTVDVIVVNSGKSAFIMSLVGIEVLIDSVMHTSVGDLEFTLSHNGITKTIIYKAGGGGDNFINTTLSDRGIDTISNGNAPFLGIYKPENPLSSFLDSDPSGTWTLSIYDGVAGNTGTLKSWGLNLIYSPGGTFTDEPYVESSLTIFPNPASSVVSIQLAVGSHQLASLEIYDLNRRKLIEKQIPAGGKTLQVDVSQLKNGVYLAQIQFENQTITKKLIIRK